jgi:hypothetical protein
MAPVHCSPEVGTGYAHQQMAAPFDWTKAVVRPAAPKQHYSSFCK